MTKPLSTSESLNEKLNKLDADEFMLKQYETLIVKPVKFNCSIAEIGLDDDDEDIDVCDCHCDCCCDCEEEK